MQAMVLESAEKPFKVNLRDLAAQSKELEDGNGDSMIAAEHHDGLRKVPSYQGTYKGKMCRGRYLAIATNNIIELSRIWNCNDSRPVAFPAKVDTNIDHLTLVRSGFLTAIALAR